jgi:hypothetical protein
MVICQIIDLQSIHHLKRLVHSTTSNQTLGPHSILYLLCQYHGLGEVRANAHIDPWVGEILLGLFDDYVRYDLREYMNT